MTMKNTDLLALQAYVTAKDNSQYDSVRQDTVVLDLTHSNLVQRHVEIRFDLHDTLDTLRQRIHQKTGTPASFQHLQLISGGSVLAQIPPSTSDTYKLGYYGLHHGMTVHCVDLDPHSGSRGGQYEDTSLVQKFVLSDEEYNQRKGTLRDWERQQKQKDANFSLAKHAQKHRELCEAQRQAKLGLPLPPNFIQDAATGKVIFVEPDQDDDHDETITTCNESVMNVPGPESVEGIEVGMRCEVQPGGRRGVVAYCGIVSEIGGGGHWVGIRFDEPVGKTDGTAGRKRYFEALQGFGGFLRGRNVLVGDYPELDILDELDDSDDEL
jgi:tubulin-folding cofactor B